MDQISHKNNFLLCLVLLGMPLIVLMGCSSSPKTVPAVASTVAAATVVKVLPTDTPWEEKPAEVTLKPVPDASPSPKALTDNAAAPQPISFRSTDDVLLDATYYPAASTPAPLVVLLHWGLGDQADWQEIAYWIQNRGLGGKNTAPQKAWLDSAWFPEMPVTENPAVFTFTLRGCEGGCKTFDTAIRTSWRSDIAAAMQTARALQGIDPQRIITIGASVGADGAAMGCASLNSVYPNSCQGAFSISPGGYLLQPYKDIVDSLIAEATPKPVWCLSSNGDTESADACASAAGAEYRTYSYEGSAHGMALIDSNKNPQPLQLMIEFMQMTLW